MSSGLDELMGRASDPAPDTMTGVLTQYIAEPDSDQTEQAGQAMHRLAEVLTGTAKQGRSLPIRLCHFRQNHMLAADLYGFNVHEFDSEGKPIDPIGSEVGPKFALVLNHPIWVQVRSILASLAQLNARQHLLQELKQRGGDVSTIDLETPRLDQEAAAEVADLLRFGWRNAAESVAQQAIANGYYFEVSYTPDLFASREEINRPT